MDRDKFMELVYETFADEPDNVLANGIIEAADAYAEHEKAQHSQKGTTSDLISRQQALDIFDDYNVSVENGELEAYSRDRKRLCDLPPIQPIATDTNVGDTISRQAVIDAVEKNACNTQRIMDAVNNLPPVQPEPHEGYWIRRDCGLDVECKCSKCGYRDFVEPGDEYWFKRNYCPNC